MIISFFRIQVIDKTRLMIIETENLHSINNNKFKKVPVDQYINC